jgi:hypothetical protein
MAASEGALGELHEVIARTLKDRIQSGEASASDLAVAVKFLKDNNISCMPTEDNAIGELEQKLKDRKAKRVALTQADLDAALAQTEFLQ